MFVVDFEVLLDVKYIFFNLFRQVLLSLSNFKLNFAKYNSKLL